MPVYEYKCEKCLNTFEVFKSVSRRDDKEKCPLCGNDETKRLISQFSSNVVSCNPSFNSGI
ncbi:MAG: zinc ribbon domain-containing protein [Thermodesulfovibrio sp.]|nr:zinc ribbon domain-containing protein [Thermodesulfovibrio sp.]